MRGDTVLRMTGETLPLLVGAGLGVGVLAGVVSGVCYLLVNGLGWSRRVHRGAILRAEGEPRTICAACGADTAAECASCSLPVCAACCTDAPGPARCRPCGNDRLILTSRLKGGHSFLQLLRENFYFGSWSEEDDKLNHLKVWGAAGSEGAQAQAEGRQVRDFLQQLAEKLAGGSLDDVSVSRMYQNPEYLPVTKTESASSAHSRLQQLVQRVIEEALHLPAFLDCSGIDRDAQGRLPEFSPSTYEDLLATAILNKVIDRYQQDLKRSTGASSSGVHSGSSSPEAGSGPGRRRGRARPRGRDNSPDQSSLEPASHDDYAHSDSSGRATDGTAVKEVHSLHNSDSSTDDEEHFTTSYSNPVDGALSNINFQNKARVIFPEYGGDIVEKNGISLDSQEYAEGSNHDDSNVGLNQNSDIYANNNSWEENWLFQKKRMKTGQSVPVPMLIPNSNTEYRALIGDRDAEDTTDLSEAGSETDDTPTDIKQMLVNSKTIIGGKNPELVLTLIDQDGNENGLQLENTITIDRSLDITVIEKKILPTKNLEDVGKDENDNQQVWEVVINPKETEGIYNPDIQLISLTQDPGETFAEVPKSMIKNDMREFLKSLESDGESEGIGELRRFEYFSTPSREETQDVFNKENVTEATNFDVIDKKEEENLDSLNGHQQESEYIETMAKPVQRHMDSLKRQHYKPAKSEETSDNEEEPPPPLPTSKLPDPSMIKAEEEIIAIVATPVLPEQIVIVSGIVNKGIDENYEIVNKYVDESDEIVNKDVDEKDEIVSKDVDRIDEIINKDTNQKDVIVNKDVDKNYETVNKTVVKNDEIVNKLVHEKDEIINKDIDQNDVIVNKDDDKNDEIVNRDVDNNYTNVNKDIDKNDEIQFIMNGKPYISDSEEKHDKDGTQIDNNPDYSEKETPPGSIAEREHRKWQNAVPMENNPYSPEAIERRLSKQSNSSLYDMVAKTNLESKEPEKNTIGVPLQVALSEGGSDIVRYGRDYYINASKKATGARKGLLGMKFESMPDEEPDAETRPKTMPRSTSEAATPSWNYNQGSLTNEDSGTTKESSKAIINEIAESHSDIYAATPVIVEDVDTQFDNLYEKAFKYGNDTHEFHALPVDLNADSIHKLLELTNGVVVNNDFLDQSDSISSQDDSPRVYNIKSGKIVSSTKDKLHNESEDENASTPNAKMNGNHNDKDVHLMPSLTRGSKSWKSMGDVYIPTHGYTDREDNDYAKLPESKIEEDIDLPSVKDLRKKFFVNKTENPPIYKPKRKISKDLLDNKIMTKSFSNSQTNLKQPQHMHSITARSVSKEFREELKLSMPASPIVHPGGSKNLPDGSEDPAKEGKSDTQPDSPVPEPGSLRNKLAFFEQLNKH